VRPPARVGDSDRARRAPIAQRGSAHVDVVSNRVVGWIAFWGMSFAAVVIGEYRKQ
jgi:hypothetical protein